MSPEKDTKVEILDLAENLLLDRGFNGFSYANISSVLKIKNAAIHYYFPSKAELAAAVAKRYWEDSAAYLESLLKNSSGPLDALRRYPETFRWALENDNRICLCSFMSAQFDDLPDIVKTEVQAFTDVNLAWLKKTLVAGTDPVALDAYVAKAYWNLEISALRYLQIAAGRGLGTYEFDTIRTRVKNLT